MLRHDVVSSNIRSIGYEQGVLEIAFHSGRIYQYSNVSQMEYNNLMNAYSHGKYFNAYIKDYYPCSRIL